MTDPTVYAEAITEIEDKIIPRQVAAQNQSAKY
jgi:hypothetical protein